MPSGTVTEADIRDWCIAYLQRTADNPSIAIGPEASFAELGLDSASSAYFIVELEEWLGIELTADVIFEHPSIAELAHHLAKRAAGDNTTR